MNALMSVVGIRIAATIVEAAPDPIYAVNQEGRYTLANEAFLQLIDRFREDLYGTDTTEVLDFETVDEFDGLIGGLLKSDERQRTVEVPLTLDGERRLFEISVALLTGDDDFRGSVGVARDITEFRERERRLTVFDRILRHNLRNKMNVILAHAAAIGEETAETGLVEHAAAIENSIGPSKMVLNMGPELFRNSSEWSPKKWGEINTHN